MKQCWDRCSTDTGIEPAQISREAIQYESEHKHYQAKLDSGSHRSRSGLQSKVGNGLFTVRWQNLKYGRGGEKRIDAADQRDQ